jgi:hypothetical protein
MGELGAERCVAGRAEARRLDEPLATGLVGFGVGGVAWAAYWLQAG